ncbi:hypothetical protein FIBSPDRAFT_1039577 [Athelia psychrophila]|uniref:Uncharacterized protein n=1 Tax=Athelia psychrophila TaxID=1759441 RepID=A0A166RN05_9AGAM|nr:hypothetical protein FIBSPDRAFT_1039577 [Fibularhizoctonia sp. CBS 109695]
MAPRTRSALRDTATAVISNKDAKAAPTKTRATRSTRQNPKPEIKTVLAKGVSKAKPKAKAPAGKAAAKGAAKEGPAKDGAALAKTQRSLRSENPGMVLRDITAHVLAPPTPRKPRASAATVVPHTTQRSPSQSAADFNAVAHSPIPMPAFTAPPRRPQPARRVSPLPPSSPPSTSSHLPAFGPSSPAHQHQDPQSLYPYPEIEPIMSDPYIFSDADGHPDVPPDDPFGFFAAEQKLKAARLRVAKGKAREEASSARVPSDGALATSIPMGPPPRTRAKRTLNFDEGDGEHGEESMLNTPSPVKISQGIMASAEAEEKGKGRGKAREERPSKRAKRDSLGTDPAEIARKLEARLPRRPKRKQAPAIVESDDEDDEQENVHPNTNRRIRSKYVAKPSSKAPGKAKVKAEDADADEEEEERRLQERQARIEYFRKLDGYKVSEENVYVV